MKWHNWNLGKPGIAAHITDFVKCDSKDSEWVLINRKLPVKIKLLNPWWFSHLRILSDLGMVVITPVCCRNVKYLT